MITFKIEIAESEEGKVNVKLISPKSVNKATNNEKLVAEEVMKIVNNALKEMTK